MDVTRAEVFRFVPALAVTDPIIRVLPDKSREDNTWSPSVYVGAAALAKPIKAPIFVAPGAALLFVFAPATVTVPVIVVEDNDTTQGEVPWLTVPITFVVSAESVELTEKAELSEAMVTLCEPVPVTPFPIKGVTPFICLTFS